MRFVASQFVCEIIFSSNLSCPSKTPGSTDAVNVMCIGTTYSIIILNTTMSDDDRVSFDSFQIKFLKHEKNITEHVETTHCLRNNLWFPLETPFSFRIKY